MSYRRSHHRRAHERTNADGSKSYVRETDVKGHNFEKKTNSSYSGSAPLGVGDLLVIGIMAGIAYLILGLILRWDDAWVGLPVTGVSGLLLYLFIKYCE